MRLLPPAYPGVALWLIDLDNGDPAADAALLSADETARAARFVFERHRRRFTAGRAAMRRRLGEETGVPPEAVAFSYGPAGKPALAATTGPTAWFNLAHSHHLALLAVSHAGAVGVDIERKRPVEDVLRLAQTAFSGNELNALRALAADEREDAFFAGWTRKEAYLKARGEGIWSLGAFDVTLNTEGPVRLARAAEGPAELDRWALVSLAPAGGYAGALCVEVRRT